MSALLAWLPVLVGAFAVVPLALAALDRRVPKVPDDRLALLQQAAETAAVLTFVRQVAAWDVTHVGAWYVLVGLGALGYAGLAWRAAAAPWVAPGRSSPRRVALSVLGTAVASALVLALILL